MKSQTYGVGRFSLPKHLYFQWQPQSLLFLSQGNGATWTYRDERENGQEEDAPERPFPEYGVATWLRETDLAAVDLYGKTPRENYWRVKYTEGPRDKAWMEEKDRNYLSRLGREVQALLAQHPADASAASLDAKDQAYIDQLQELCRSLPDQLRDYEHPKFERIEQQLLEAKEHLPDLLASAPQTNAVPQDSDAAAADTYSPGLFGAADAGSAGMSPSTAADAIADDDTAATAARSAAEHP
jgi:hypothetical protein